jgi:anthranilate phosphoribosyltransferase
MRRAHPEAGHRQGRRRRAPRESEAEAAFGIIMSGEATPAQIGGLLMALRVRGETVDEMTGAVRAMRAKMLAVEAPAGCDRHRRHRRRRLGHAQHLDRAAFVVAGCGVPVAKHGNRALSSKSGAADVLPRSASRSTSGRTRSPRCIREAGIGFMFAPRTTRRCAMSADPGGARHPHHLQPARPAVQPGRREAQLSACSRGSGSSRWRRC